jgi:hypothetical protein
VTSRSAAPNAYLHYFELIRYYLARGTLTELSDDIPDGFFNSTRYNTRTLLPFLGDHRVSGIFLEAPSVGNFGAIAFAWVLLHDRQRFWTFVAKSVAIAMIIVVADGRFGLYFCIFHVGALCRNADHSSRNAFHCAFFGDDCACDPRPDQFSKESVLKLSLAVVESFLRSGAT